MSDHPIDPFDPAIAALIRRKAATIARSMTDPSSDRDDLVQDLLVALLARRRQFDRPRGDPGAFVHTILSHAAADIQRSYRAAKRSPTLVPTEAAETCIDRRQAEFDDSRDLVEDVQGAIARLPAELREAAELLIQKNVAGVARELKVTRDTVYARLRLIRKRFERAGLAIYLHENFDTSKPDRVVTCSRPSQPGRSDAC